MFALTFGAIDVAIDVKKAPRAVRLPHLTTEAPRWRGRTGQRRAGRLPSSQRCPYQFAKFHDDLRTARPGVAQLREMAGPSRGVTSASAEALETVKNFVESMGGVPAVDKFESVGSTTVSAKR